VGRIFEHMPKFLKHGSAELYPKRATDFSIAMRYDKASLDDSCSIFPQKTVVSYSRMRISN